MQLNPVTARLLQLIDENDDKKSGEELLLILADELKYADANALVAHGNDAMQQMKQSQILLGTLKPAA